MTTASEMNVKVAKFETNMQRFDDVINGGSGDTVTIDGAVTVPTLQNFYAQTEVIALNGVLGLAYKLSTTTADADPGAGYLRLNHATVSSATAVYIDNVDDNAIDVSAIIDTWDDSTNTVRGQLTIRSRGSAAFYHVFNVTGSVVDGTGYRKLTVAHVGGTGVVSADLECWALFNIAGNKGADGLGSGDVVGPASSTDNEIPLFDSTTGKLLKGSGKTLNDAFLETLIVAISDETTALEEGTAQVTFRMPFAMNLLSGKNGIRASVNTAQTSGDILTIDVKASGSTILSTLLTIDNTEKTSYTAAAEVAISDASLADDEEITVDITQIGDGTAKGLKLTLRGTRS